MCYWYDVLLGESYCSVVCIYCVPMCMLYRYRCICVPLHVILYHYILHSFCQASTMYIPSCSTLLALSFIQRNTALHCLNQILGFFVLLISTAIGFLHVFYSFSTLPYTFFFIVSLTILRQEPHFFVLFLLPSLRASPLTCIFAHFDL